MQMWIDIQDPIPPELNQSYTGFGYYNFGVCCWNYEYGYDGIIEWINTLHFMTMPKYPNPVSFRYYFKPGVIAKVTPHIEVRQDIPDTEINGILYNAVTGLNMPPVFP